MINVIRELLVKIVNDIDTGNTNIEWEDQDKIVELLTQIGDKNKKLSKYQACKYLGVSRATFDNYVRDGLIPPGRHQQGFKEIFFYESDLRKFKNNK